ncbi:hypothetical protein [Longitalea luteola]|uniref:hypothetical protein n=1 Tax=Longitalea luteola TaxID=2812563 RepID=UPI001A97B813|nr:hypothetical protein [Longitalea luteola]
MKKIALVALVCFIFSACKKDKDAAGVGVIISGALAKEYYHKQVDQVRIFYYNKDKTLKQYEYSFDNNVAERVEFRYVEGRLASLDLYKKDNNTWKLVNQTMPVYYNNKRLSDIIIVYPGDPVPSSGILTWPAKYTFQYENDTSTRFSACIVYHRENNTLIPNAEYRFEYDSLGNITVEEQYTINNGTKTKQSVTIYEYLQQKNPKYQMEDILDFQAYNSPNIWERKTVGYLSSGMIDEYKRVYEFNADSKVTTFTEQPSNVKRYYEYY